MRISHFSYLPVCLFAGLTFLLSCGGGGSSDNKSGAATPGHAYVVNASSGTIWTFSINPTTGALSLAGNQVNADQAPHGLVLDAGKQYAYVACRIAGTVNVFSFDVSTFRPQQVATASTGPESGCLALSPNGQYLYVGGQNGIFSFSTSNSGSLTSTGSVVASGSVTSLAMDPLGRVIVSGDGTSLRVHTLDQATGRPSSSPILFPQSHYPDGILFHPSGKVLFVLNGAARKVTVLTVSAAGNLAVLNSIDTGIGPVGMTVDPAGRFLFVANSGDRTISTFAISADGNLKVGSTSISESDYSWNLSVTPDSKFLISSHDANSMGVFTIDGTTGALSFNGNSPIGGDPRALVFR